MTSDALQCRDAANALLLAEDTAGRIDVCTHCHIEAVDCLFGVTLFRTGTSSGNTMESWYRSLRSVFWGCFQLSCVMDSDST